MQGDKSVEKAYAIIGKESDLSASGKHIQSIDKIPKRIEELTEELSTNGGVVDAPIHLKVVGKNMPTLTLIDLPGITHISVNNAQEDIHSHTSSLVEKYIENSNMIILCVIPANEDFANAEAIKLAKRYDPDGVRTIGVVTKIDTCTEHTKIDEKLKGIGNNVKLGLGFIAVRNKLPNEKELSIHRLRQLESDFFKSSSLFKNVSKEFYGTEKLISKITKLQIKEVDKYLPKMKAQLIESIKSTEDKLSNSSLHLQSDGEKMQYIMRIVMQIRNMFKDLAEGCYPNNCQHKMLVRLGNIYDHYSNAVVDVLPDFLSEEWENKIAVVIKESQEILLDNFMSQNAFKTIFKDTHIEIYKDLSEKLISQIAQYVELVYNSIISECISTNFTELREKIKNNVAKNLEKNKELCFEFIKNLISSEEFIFTKNTQYNEIISENGEISNSLAAYSFVSSKRFIDYCCMLCQKYLIKDMYDIDFDLTLFSKSINDDPEAFKERNFLTEKLQTYKQNLTIIENIAS